MTSEPKVDYTGSKQEAIEQFRRRRRLAANMEKVDNSALHAGAPMYFYCRHCGLPTEMLPEDYVFPPTTECSQCRGLKNEGWLDEAIRMVEIIWISLPEVGVPDNFPDSW